MPVEDDTARARLHRASASRGRYTRRGRVCGRDESTVQNIPHVGRARGWALPLAGCLAACGPGPKDGDTGAGPAVVRCSGDSVARGADEVPPHWDRSIAAQVEPLMGTFTGELALETGELAPARLTLAHDTSAPAWTREDELGAGEDGCTSLAFVAVEGSLEVEGLLEPVAVELPRVGVRPDWVVRTEQRLSVPPLLGEAAELAREDVLLCVRFDGEGAPAEQWLGWSVTLALCTSGEPTWASMDEEWARLRLGAGLLEP